MPPRAVLLLVPAVCAVALTGSGHAPAQADPDTSVTTTIYFLTPDRSAPIGVRRSIPGRSPYALAALRTLLAGPTEAEAGQGLTSALPAGIRLLSFRIDHSTSALVDLDGLPSTGDGVERARLITQVVRTLVGLSGIEHVRIRNQGEPWGMWLMTGGVDADSYGYEDLLGLHVGSAKPGTEAVTGDHFDALP
jgi:hypothetical protein